MKPLAPPLDINRRVLETSKASDPRYQKRFKSKSKTLPKELQINQKRKELFLTGQKEFRFPKLKLISRKNLLCLITSTRMGRRSNSIGISNWKSQREEILMWLLRVVPFSQIRLKMSRN
jgi:hypothetical protein